MPERRRQALAMPTQQAINGLLVQLSRDIPQRDVERADTNLTNMLGGHAHRTVKPLAFQRRLANQTMCQKGTRAHHHSCPTARRHILADNAFVGVYPHSEAQLLFAIAGTKTDTSASGIGTDIG